MEIFYKQPSEKFPIAADFSNALATESGEAINPATSEVIAEDYQKGETMPMLLSGVTYEDKRIIAIVQGGDEGDYKITFRAGTTLGYVYEIDVMMRIKEE